MGSIRSLVLMQLMVLLNVILTVKASTPAVAKPGCRRRCGDVIIPYPFGTGGDCNITAGFFINCNTSFIPHKPFLRNGNIEVINVSTDGQLRILSNTSYDCYNTSYRNWFFYSFRLSKFLINNNKNKFTAIGCDTYAVVKQAGSYGQRYATGCLSFCNNITDVSNGSCSGIGCCQTSIPKDVRSYNISLRSYANHTNVLPENHCSYAFVAEVDSYTFSASDLRGFEFQSRQFPITLDWNIGNTSCNEANMDVNNFACKEYSKCVDSENNSGYLCKCLEGYEGNPYLPNGCQDINECESMSPCNGTARCTNLPGTYNCSCPVGYEGDGKKSGTGCSLPNKDQSKTSPLIAALGVAIGFLGLLLGIVLWCWMLRQRQISKLREANFQQNGGILLREQLSKRQGYREDVKVFTAEELEKATNNYNESRILGQGGLGTVYKGILADNQIVAIKKSIIGDPSQVEQFINEIMVLYKINHRNVVKLLGCCLETQVPLLVYEYITTRTLFHHLHNDDATSYLSWETRLRIATETAEALSYLHSAASIPIIHRDIKLANILLDDNYTTKVFDFGASRLIPSDQAQITTIVQGTFGYLDPEYMLSSLLTEKSDVYSFGVVLMELLTGQKVVCFKRPEENRVLPMYFTSLMKEDRLLDILDPQVLNDENVEQFMEVATLARRCVRVKGEERPTMKEVSHELAGLQAMAKHPWSKSNLVSEESEYLLGKFPSTYDDGVTSSSIGMGYDSINNKITFELEGAR